MFGLSWSEMLIIAIVTLILVGPQDIPKVIRGLSQAFNMAQKMAAEFKGHFSELAREVNVQELSKHLEMPKIDLERRIADTVDSDRTIRDSFSPDAPKIQEFAAAGERRETISLEAGTVPERPKEIWEEEASQYLFEEMPSLLPPRTALRLAEEKKEWRRPSVIPPMTAFHDGQRAIVSPEISLLCDE